jgi:methionine synthase I (cobalamin-dependent)
LAPDPVRIGPLELNGRRPLDGAMGSDLLRRSGSLGSPALARWSVERPDLVRGVHRDHAAAGAQMLTANTLLAWREPDAETLVGNAVERAREAADLPVAVSLGPGATPPVYTLLASAARDAGAALIQLETFTRATDLVAAVGAVGAVALPIAALLVVGADGRTIGDALPFATAAGELRRAGAAAVGLNCQSPDIMAAALRSPDGRLPEDLVCLLRPSAGIPKQGGECAEYPWPPPSWAEATLELLSGGHPRWLLGGCCGAGPAHIAALTERLSTLTERLSTLNAT